MTRDPVNKKKMVVVRNKCHKRKERDEISKNVNFEATDIYGRDFTVILTLTKFTEIIRKTATGWQSLSFEFLIDPYHSMSKQKILPVEPLIQCEAGRAKTMQRQSLYSPRTPKWPPSDKGELTSLVSLHRQDHASHY